MKGLSLALAALVLAHASALSVPESAGDRRELVTHVHHTSSYGNRNQSGPLEFLIGLALLGIAPLLLVMTEVQGVKVAKLVNKARASTLANIPSASIDPGLEGLMVHTTGPLSVKENESGVYVDEGTGVKFGLAAGGTGGSGRRRRREAKRADDAERQIRR